MENQETEAKVPYETSHIAVIGAGGSTVLLAIYGSAIVSNAAILALTTTAGLSFIARKLPKRVQRTLVRHSFMTDASAATATYFVLGKTVTSLLAAGIVGCLTSAIIWAARPYVLDEDEEEFVIEVIVD